MSAVPDQSAIKTRPMNELDLEAIYAIELEAYPHPWTRGIFKDCLRVGYSCWVYEQDDDIIGYCVFTLQGDESHILNLCVRTSYQGQGWGVKLLEHVLDIGRRRGVETMLLEVRPSNKAAICLYKKAGFNEVGMRREYYPDKSGREDALIMAMEL